MRFGQLGIQLHGAPGGLEGAIGHFQRRRQPHVRRADPGRQRPRGGISAEDAFTGKLQGALHVAGFVSLPHGLEQVGGEERLGFRLAGGLRERRSIFDAGLYQTHRPEAMLAAGRPRVQSRCVPPPASGFCCDKGLAGQNHPPASTIPSQTAHGLTDEGAGFPRPL
jgi:hypothetical protein